MGQSVERRDVRILQQLKLVLHVVVVNPECFVRIKEGLPLIDPRARPDDFASDRIFSGAAKGHKP